MFWQNANYEWATDYVYGIEKDYRLVKVGKVGCYLHGDGLANVILSDGLGNFVNTKDYKGKLHKANNDNSKDNQQFDIILSNPPYSVSSFKQTTREYYTEKDFELYNSLTDNSSEIECLFVERTKQLLKDGGVAGIILPSSILTNSGIYTKTRELLLKYFEIVGITELGSNTFMATGTNTVVLFLRRRNNYEGINLQKSIDKFFTNFTDVTINEIETPFSKYVSYVWEGLAFEDYITLLEKNPNDKVKNHDLYKEYSQKIKQDKEFWNKVITEEKEKLYYFILAYPQKVVIIKTGEKDAEKQFLGYEFSNRRGSEGIHAIQRGKSIDDCTRLFDINSSDNPQKASTYIYKAFKNENIDIDESLKDNISKVNLLDMMTFDRADFEKTINLKAKKKIKIESKYSISKVGELVDNLDSQRIPLSKNERITGKIPYYGSTGVIDYVEKYIFEEQLVLIGEDGAKWGENENSAFIICGKSWVNNHAHVLRPHRNKVLDKYLVEILNKLDLSAYITGQNVPKLNQTNLNEIQIPLPPIDIQQKIVDEIEEIENNKLLKYTSIKDITYKVNNIVDNISGKFMSLQDVCSTTITDGTHQTPTYCSKTEGYPFISAKDVTQRKIDWSSKTIKYIIPELHEKLYKRIAPRKNDILLAKNGTIGVAALVEDDYIFDIYVTLALLRPNTEIILPKYLLYVINSKQCYSQFEKSISKGMGVPNLHLNQIKNVKIPLPSIEQQQKIVTQIEELEKQIDESQKSIDASAKLKNAVLKKYL